MAATNHAHQLLTYKIMGMAKHIKALLGTTLSVCISMAAFAQTGQLVFGKVEDSTRHALRGCTVKVVISAKDILATTTDTAGRFVFLHVPSKRITVYFSFVGYQALIKHYRITGDSLGVDLGIIMLHEHSTLLNPVTIAATKAVSVREDTVEYPVSAYPVRENAPILDVIRKLPGVDVDQSGNITAQGKTVTKVRVNGKDFMAGDVRALTQTLPADVAENIQIIDDYGDQANITGIKTGDPSKILNINIRKDKNHGFTAQATLGDGTDLQTKQAGETNDNRHLALINTYRFNGDQQMALLGNINNTNANTFSFGSTASSGGPVKISLGGKSLSISGVRIGYTAAGGNLSQQASPIDGITDTRSLGFNYRDAWFKNVSVYGSYSFADNRLSKESSSLQQNNFISGEETTQTTNNEMDHTLNHRFDWNAEYKIDTNNYLKVTAGFSYATVRPVSASSVSYGTDSAINSSYTSNATGNSSTPNYSATALFNHRFIKRGRNFSANFSISDSYLNQFQNLQYEYTKGQEIIPDQKINSTNHSVNFNSTLAYIEPLSQTSWLEADYSFSQSINHNDKMANALDTATDLFVPDSTLSSLYHFDFMTNRGGLNWKLIEKKFNIVIGASIQHSLLQGDSGISKGRTNLSQSQYSPEVRLVYRFSENKVFTANVNGYSSTPSYSQLQPTIDYSNPSYPVQGNPKLGSSFTTNFNVGYNNFDFSSGNSFFTNVSFSQIQNKVASNLISDPAHPGSLLTQYLNANGYFSTSGYASFSMPWDQRKYNLMASSTASYTNNIGFLTSIDSSGSSKTLKNMARTMSFTPGLRFRVDLKDVMDAQIQSSYAINHTVNSVKNSFTQSTSDFHTWSIGLSAKNYLHDWAISYDFSKIFQYGYSLGGVTNPAVFNSYVERRFLKGHKATIRLSVFDVFNQNRGYMESVTSTSVTQNEVNRLGRYLLLSFTLRLQRFVGSAKSAPKINSKMGQLNL